MFNDFQPSENYADFFFLALDHAFGSIQDGGGPLIPFVMTVNQDGERDLRRFVTERIEDGLAHAQAYVDSNQDKMEMYAIAWDGYVTIEDERVDAVLVEAGIRSEPTAIVLCQRYREVLVDGARGKKCEGIGNPALIDRPKTRFNVNDI